MTDGGTEHGRARREFTTTHWSLVLAAADSANPGSREALASLCETYWFPVYAYVRRRGHDADTARDLTQGFFATLLEKNYVKTADRERGRFRSFLLASVKHYLADERDRRMALKRGGRIPHLALDFTRAERRYRLEPTDGRTPERIFERRWALRLVDRTLERLRTETTRAGGRERYERLSPFLTGDAHGVRYRKVAADLGTTEDAVKMAVHRLRKRFRGLLREEVARTVGHPDAVQGELDYLMRVIRS